MFKLLAVVLLLAALAVAAPVVNGFTPCNVNCPIIESGGVPVTPDMLVGLTLESYLDYAGNPA
jgi:hypothetical protein